MQGEAAGAGVGSPTIFGVIMEGTEKILREYVEFYVNLVQSVGYHNSTTRTVRVTRDIPLEKVKDNYGKKQKGRTLQKGIL